MTKKTTDESGSIFPLLIVTGLAAVASYTLVGAVPYGWATLGMIGLVFVLGASNQMKRSNALIVNILLGGLACGSVVLISMGLGSQALIARAVAFLIFAFVGLSAFGALLKILFSMAGLVLLVFLIGYAVQTVDDNGPISENDVLEEPIGDDNQPIEEREAEPHDENDQLLSHTQQWRDYSFNSYQGDLEIWQSNYVASSTYKNKKLKPKRTNDPKVYWGSIYAALVRNDSEYMERILDTFLQTGRKSKLDQMEFVQMVVSCVQSIPYVLIYREDCNELAQTNPALAELAQKHSCKGNVTYGLQSPAEFMQDMQGDCDTRTVFLFTILDKLGYKVAILNSDTYGHSMLGVALPASGKYKDYQGQHYYFWETTAQGWNIGTLPPDMGQIKHWYVVLAN